MICAIGISLTQIWLFSIVYFSAVAVTLYHIVNQKDGWQSRFTKIAITLFIPFIGIILVWGNSFLRKSV